MAESADSRDLELAARQLHTMQKLFQTSIGRCLDVGFYPDELALILGLPFDITEGIVREWFPGRD